MPELTWGKRFVVLSLLALAVTGCSSTDMEEEQGPAPLIDFDEERKFNKVWSTSIGDGQGGIFNRLTPAIDGEMIYVAAANGDVEAVSLSKGKTIWDVDLDRLLVGGVGVGENILLVGAASGDVIALNKETGEQFIEDAGLIVNDAVISSQVSTHTVTGSPSQEQVAPSRLGSGPHPCVQLSWSAKHSIGS